MEFLIALWELYVSTFSFILGFGLGFSTIEVVRESRIKIKEGRWDQFGWGARAFIMIAAILFFTLLFILWPITITAMILHWLWKGPCLWIGRLFVKDKRVIDYD